MISVVATLASQDRKSGLDAVVDWDLWTQQPARLFDSVLPVVMELSKAWPGHLGAESVPGNSNVRVQDLRKDFDLRGLTVRQVLDRLVEIDARYEWRQLGGFAVIRPRDAWTDPENFLNKKIAAIAMAHTDLNHVIERLRELAGGSEHYSTMVSAPFDLEFKGGTVLDLLNETIQTYGGMAWHIEHPREEMRVFFTESRSQTGPGFYVKRRAVIQR
jgi:hypothetical protein